MSFAPYKINYVYPYKYYVCFLVTHDPSLYTNSYSEIIIGTRKILFSVFYLPLISDGSPSLDMIQILYPRIKLFDYLT